MNTATAAAKEHVSTLHDNYAEIAPSYRDNPDGLATLIQEENEFALANSGHVEWSSIDWRTIAESILEATR